MDQHWAIVSKETTYYEGDERSRTNPGHGYPAGSTTNMVYTRYDTEEELYSAIARRGPNNKDYFVIKADVYAITTETKMKLVS